MKVIKINLISKSITEHEGDENFIHDLLNTNRVVYSQMDGWILIYPVYTNIEKCFSLKLFPERLIMANAILVGGTIDNYTDVPFDCETIRTETYFLHDKIIVSKELQRLEMATEVDFNSKIQQKFHPSWYEKLESFLKTETFKNILKKVNSERKTEVVHSHNEEMFKQFEKQFSKNSVIFYPTSSKNSPEIWKPFMDEIKTIML